MRCGFGDARATRGSRIQTGHLRGHTAFIQKNQLLQRYGAEGLDERFPPLAVLFRLPFGRVE
jgi:hypothetical protein